MSVGNPARLAMTLRTKALIIMGAAIVGLNAVVYATSLSIFEAGFAGLEQQSIQRDVERGAECVVV
jgi:sensor domain CHASE-containing protein